MTKTILMLTILTMYTMCLHAQKQELTLLKGHVTNQEGKPISGANIIVHYIFDDKPFATATTDGEGFYDITFESEYAVSDYYGYFASVEVSAKGCATYMREADPIAPYFISGKEYQDFTLYDALTFKVGEQSSIVLPITPDPNAGKYYELSRLEHEGMDSIMHRPQSQLVFTREMEPKANTPYLFVPGKDYTVSLEGLNLSGVPELISVGDSVFFVSGYMSESMELPENYSILLLGNSPCCHQPGNDERAYRRGACHGFIILKDGYNIINGLSIVLEESGNTEVTKCATPSIAFADGKLVFSCATPGAVCTYKIKGADGASGIGGEATLGLLCEICVCASAEGYADSDVATATIGWRDGRPVMEGFSSIDMGDGTPSCDVNGDGIVDVADIATVISIMAGQSSE